jgi:beta-glucanase (GH16 family)
MRNSKIFFLLAALIMISCSKAESADPAKVAPSGLTVQATIAQDSSGNVSFVASATNATGYEFDFGDGVSRATTDGKISYKYSKSGLFNVTVLAKNDIGFTSKSIKVDVIVATAVFWSDEFNYTGSPDGSKWGYDIGTGSNGWGNAEQQYYTDRPENAYVSNGTLKITAKAENFGGKSYTSSRMLTKGKFVMQYGKVEVRAKLPKGGGTWPAIWMLGSNIDQVGWPACGEIDIMEHLGNQENKIYHTLHYPGHSGGNATGFNHTISNATTEFHVYTMEWTAASILFFVDGTLKYTFPNNSTVPYNHNFFIILNVAMGGNFGGAIDPAFSSGAMEIDYIRVYK